MENPVINIGVILTFLATLFSIYYTRKNIKTTKYIETITTERIKWISIIRQDISEIISNIFETLENFKKEINFISSQDPSEKHRNSVAYEHQENVLNARTENALAFNERTSFVVLIGKLMVFKLRLNHKEDKEIIRIIDYFIEFYQLEYKSDKDIINAKIEIKNLTENIQIMLKQEWEKVKEESRGGKTCSC
ncbi:MAG: hypothetical protein WCY06_02945 [Flavobacteriaceae bacterium]